MKSILKSESPKRCEQIANGKCTILLSKTEPKLETPFKGYIYCTQQTSSNVLMVSIDGKQVIIGDYRNASLCDQYGCPNWNIGEGKVIGEFVCDKVDTYNYHKGLTKFGGSLGLPIGTYDSYLIFEDDYKAMCLTYDEVKEYGNGKTLYGLHISQLKIYDMPRELSEFYSTGHCFNLHNVACTEGIWGDYIFHYSQNSLCRACKYLNDLGDCEKEDTRLPVRRKVGATWKSWRKNMTLEEQFTKFMKYLDEILSKQNGGDNTHDTATSKS